MKLMIKSIEIFKLKMPINMNIERILLYSTICIVNTKTQHNPRELRLFSLASINGLLFFFKKKLNVWCSRMDRCCCIDYIIIQVE
jgi:hypothetical protein